MEINRPGDRAYSIIPLVLVHTRTGLQVWILNTQKDSCSSIDEVLLENWAVGATEVVQWLRALILLAEDMGPISGDQLVAHNHP